MNDSGLSAPTPASSPPRTFLPYLEGMRGFFSLYIALIHGCYYVLKVRPHLPPLPVVISQFDIVVMFMVISGYVLGLPVARRGQTFHEGLATFAKRRALRILPAYYAALLFAIPIAVAVAGHRGTPFTPRTLAAAIVLHVFLLHDLVNKLIYSIDAPMWSIAIESQIYVLFPLLLVPLARRFGFVTMVVAGFAVGLLPTLAGALHHSFGRYWLSNGCFWFIGEFALGYAAANLSLQRGPAATRLIERVPWQQLALGSLLVAIGAAATTSDVGPLNGNVWIPDIFIGLAIAAQFTADERARRAGRRTLFERFFLWKPWLLLGTFSYSFYLIHEPIIALFTVFAPTGSSDLEVVLVTVSSIGVAIALSYGFYLVIERPFMTAYRRRGDAESLRSAGDAGQRPTADASDLTLGERAAVTTGD